jgi:hypothetical protein
MESARGGGGGDGRHHLETLALVSKEGTDPPPYPLLVLFVDLSWAEDSYLFSDLITTVFFSSLPPPPSTGMLFFHCPLSC